jgi:hypothetical protein
LLLAAIIAVELAITVLVAGSCAWLVLSGQYKVGACENVVLQIRDIWAEMLAAILALLLASRAPPPPPPDEPP